MLFQTGGKCGQGWSFAVCVCNAFYIGETRHSLPDCMNGHCFTTTILNPDLSVAIHTQSHQIPFQECWSVIVIHKLPKFHPWPHLPPVWNSISTCPPITSHPWSQHPLTPSSTLTPVSVFSTLLLKKATVFSRKFLLCFLSTLCRPDDANHAVQVSVALSILSYLLLKKNSLSFWRKRGSGNWD